MQITQKETKREEQEYMGAEQEMKKSMEQGMEQTGALPAAGDGKPEVRLHGVRYRLRFDLYAMELIEQAFGGIREAFEAMSGGANMVGSVRKLFAILANCQRNYDGEPENVTGQEITAHETLYKLREVSAAIRAAVQEGMKAETYGGEADDEKRDALAEEYEQKNG